MAATSEDANEPLYVYPMPKGLDVSCPVCFKALYEDPYISVECGHHFCGSCCERLHECPKCRCRLQTIPDRGLQRALKSLQVYCSERDAGCSWEGELGELQKHQEDDCVYFEVECSFCTTMSGPRHQVLKHEQEECLYRPVTCEHCNFQCNWRELNEVHYQECPVYPVDCSICNETVARRDVERHKNDLCPKVSVACEAHKYGCDWVGLPEEQVKHLKSSWVSHFSMCTQHCCSELESVKERIDKSMDEISIKVETAQETIETCQEEIRQLKKENYDKDKEITSLRQKVSQLQDSTMMDHIISRLKSEVKEEMEGRLKKLEIQMKEFAGGRGIIKQSPISEDDSVISFGSVVSSISDH